MQHAESAPIGVWKCYFPPFLGNQEKNMRVHKEVTLPIILAAFSQQYIYAYMFCFFWGEGLGFIKAKPYRNVYMNNVYLDVYGN